MPRQSQGLRAYHQKSKGGCLTCKRRRIKCDESTPSCKRCMTSSRSCEYPSETTPAPHFRGFRNLTSAAFGTGECGSQSVTPQPPNSDLEYFHRRTLPVLRHCDASPIWDRLCEPNISSEPLLLQTAAAVGLHHRLVDEDLIDQSDVSRSAYEALTPYLSHIDDDSSSVAKILGFILMTVLESLRGASMAIYAHLKTTLRLIQIPSANHTDDEHLREAVRLVKQFSMSAALFNARSRQALDLHDMLRELLSGEAAVGKGSDRPLTHTTCLWRLESDLLSFMRLVYQPRGINVADHRESIVEGMRLLQQQVQANIESKMLAPDATTHDFTHEGFALARSLMIKVFVNCAWNRCQTDYDAAIDAFRWMVDIEERCLKSMHWSDAGCDSIPTFSIGLGAIWVLTFVGLQCRDRALRRRALRLLRSCPANEGPWNARYSELYGAAVIRFEEENAAAQGSSGGIIPEDCRAQAGVLVVSDDDKPTICWEFADVVYRPDLSSESLVTKRIRLWPENVAVLDDST